MAVKSQITLESYVGKSVDRISGSHNSPSAVFIDTGAVIDIEKDLRRLRLVDRSATVSNFYFHLKQNGIRFFMPSYTFEEVENHHLNHSVSGFQEVSDEHMAEVSKMYSDFSGFLSSNISQGNLDKIRYDCFWASKIAFAPNHKKFCKDPCSLADRELVSYAFWTRSILDSFVQQGRTKKEYSVLHLLVPPQVVLLSPDCHIKGISEVLTNANNYIQEHHPNLNLDELNFGYYPLRVATTR